MIKFCPECGVKLDKEFKFCPECGFALENIKNENSPDNDSTEPVVCKNCGEENSPENTICAGCGIKLQDSSEAPQPKKAQSNKHSNKSSKADQRKSKDNRGGKRVVEEKPVKALSPKTLIGIIGIGLITILAILLLTGQFDTENVTVNNAGTNQLQNSGVDLGNLQKINDMEAKLRANPGDNALLLALAHLKNDSGLYEQAIVDYRKYLKAKPGDADARIDMGVCYYNLGDNKTAISEMEEALKYNPHHQIGFLNLGVVNLSAGNIEKSDDWFKKAIQENPNNDIAKRAKELLESHGK